MFGTAEEKVSTVRACKSLFISVRACERACDVQSLMLGIPCRCTSLVFHYIRPEVGDNNASLALGCCCAFSIAFRYVCTYAVVLYVGQLHIYHVHVCVKSLSYISSSSVMPLPPPQDPRSHHHGGHLLVNSTAAQRLQLSSPPQTRQVRYNGAFHRPYRTPRKPGSLQPTPEAPSSRCPGLSEELLGSRKRQ